ncbi:MAG: efflux RND transporter permease subunit [Sphingomonadales bacterium]
MGITKQCMKNPAAIAVIVVGICFLGLVSLTKLPVQLFPNIERPVILVQTGWRAASPREIESEINEPLEKVLQGLPGLKEMQSNSFAGGSWINLTFGLGTDMRQMLIEVISRLNRLPPLPVDADPPIVHLGGWGGGSSGQLAWFFVQLLPENDGRIADYIQFVKDVVVPRIEAVPGVAGVDVGAGGLTEPELQIIFDPFRAAENGIRIPEIAARVGRANDVSGGFVDVGRRQYGLRFRGRYSPEQLSGLILDWRDGRPVRLGDIADIRAGRAKAQQAIYQNGNPALGIRVDRETGANVLKTLTAVKEVVAELRDGPLKEQGLSIAISFDSTLFINRAISLLTNNLMIGTVLATLVLWWFLRHARATALIAMTVPISLFTTFIVLNLTGRSLNVISLAGLAFAVGMVMDAAIVVLENIVRLREKGVGKDEAVSDGTGQIWGALVASTATTVAIFMPVLFLEDAAGQLFRDLALTIAIGVTVSLAVAVTVLPTTARYWLTRLPPRDGHGAIWDRLSAWIMRATDTFRRRLMWIGGLMLGAIIATSALLPELDYLPPVKRNAIDAFMSTPPGTSMETLDREIIAVINDRLKPYMNGDKEPALLNYYIWTWPGGGTIGARPLDSGRMKDLEAVLNREILAGLPDTQGFASQGDLFGGFGAEGGSVAVHLQSSDVRGLLEAGSQGIALLRAALPNANINPPAIAGMAQPELRITPNDERILEAGWTRGDVARIVRALGSGLWLGEHFDGDKRLDIIMRAERWNDPEQFAAIPLVTLAGHVVPLGELVELERTVGPSSLTRVDGRRTITLNVAPPQGMSLQQLLDIIRNEVEPQLRAVLPPDGSIRYGGSANSLKNAISTMSLNFALALGMLFLLMAALFKSVRDSLMVVISIPLATVGGVAALRLLNLVTFQSLDLLTMIGFIILLGLVVNNAILLVHQTRRGEARGLSRRDAVAQSLRMRLRPIFMSTLTSLFGMAPLLLFPGVGSAIYRGMAAAIVGGMSLSTIFTLILLPSLLRLNEGRHVKRAGIVDHRRPASESAV